MSDVYLTAGLSAGATVTCDTRAYRVASLTWSGDIAPNSTIEIDVENCVIEIDGVNDVSEFAGELFDVLSGTNVLTYTDSEGSRTILLKVVKRDRQA